MKVVNEKTRLFHLGSDSIPLMSAYEAFERNVPGASAYWVFPGYQQKRFLPDGPSVHRIEDFEGELDGVIAAMRLTPIMVIHQLDSKTIKIVESVSEEQKVVWLAWGPDIRGCRGPFEHLLPSTRALVFKERFYRKGLRGWLQGGRAAAGEFAYRLGLGTLSRTWNSLERAYEAAIRRIDIMVTPLDSEYHDFAENRRKVPEQSPGPIYAMLSKRFESLRHLHATGRCVMVGHSAYGINNHVDAFELLAETQAIREIEKVVVPLNYGNAWYRDVVAEVGRDMFGDKFEPLYAYEDFESFAERLAACSALVMNQKFQQGLGTMLLALWVGCRVYLHSDNPAFGWLRREGAVLFPVTDLLTDARGLAHPLETPCRERNRKVLSRLYSPVVVDENVQALLRRTKFEEN